MEVFNHLKLFPDITKRFVSTDIAENLSVTIAPSFGSGISMSYIAGYGRIIGYGVLLSQSNINSISIEDSESKKRVIVEVETIVAPSLIIPLYKKRSFVYHLNQHRQNFA